MDSSKASTTVDEDVAAIIDMRAQDVAQLHRQGNPRNENHQDFIWLVAVRLQEISQALLDGTLEINSGTGTAESSK